MKKIEEERAVAYWQSGFWRIIYFISGIVLLVSGRIWMYSTDETTIMPLLTMIAGIILLTIAIRAWPRRGRF